MTCVLFSMSPTVIMRWASIEQMVYFSCVSARLHMRLGPSFHPLPNSRSPQLTISALLAHFPPCSYQTSFVSSLTGQKRSHRQGRTTSAKDTRGRRPTGRSTEGLKNTSRRECKTLSADVERLGPPHLLYAGPRERVIPYSRT